MSALATLLRDRRRSQSGSVLSGVLIMTAFIAIVAGALMTELSTNFLLSNNLVNRAGTEATINSAMALAFDSMQRTPLVNGCPAPTSTALNGQRAVVAYSGCGLVVDPRSPQYLQHFSRGAYNVDGSHTFVARAGVDLYMVGTSAGDVYQYNFGDASPLWRWSFPATVTGPPLSMADLSGDWDDITDVVPLTANASSPPECSSGGCAALLMQDIFTSPVGVCYMPAGGPVTSKPAAGVNNPNSTLFGDAAGNVYAYLATRNGNCAPQASASTAGGQAVVGGPLVFAGAVSGSARNDELYVLTSDGSSSSLQHLTFTIRNNQPPALSLDATLGLPAANAVGFAADLATLPARIAVSFADGTVALVQVRTNFSMSLLGSAAMTSGIADAPAWCCGAAPSLIGVAGTHTLYVLNGSLSLVGSQGVGVAALSTSPAADPAGDWFVGAGDGYVYEMPAIQATPVPIKLGSGRLGQVTSSVEVGGCATGVCVYAGSVNLVDSIIQLNARSVVMTACISVSPPACSGENPRLWAQVEVGSASGPRTVHIEGWSYYSP